MTELPVRIYANGAIVFKQTSIDGCGKTLYRVVTHAHADHYRHVRTSSKVCKAIVATSETFSMLEGLGIHVPESKKHILEPGSKIKTGEGVLKFLHAEHIPGSVSTIVEDEDLIIGYTGDFRLDGTQIIEEPDILVIDATYGSPNHIRSWRNEDVLDEILSIIDESTDKVWIYGYYGKIQGLLLKMREFGFKKPVIMTSRMFKVTKELAKTIRGLGEFHLYGSNDSKEFLRNGDALIFDHSTNFQRYRNSRGGIHILLNGWEFRKPVVQIDKHSYIASYSDHADYLDTLEYVKESKPKMVIVDASRSEYAGFFAFMVRKKLGIPAFAMPGD